MKVERFVERMKVIGIKTFVGIPDSTLKEFCDYLNKNEAQEFEHFVPANEGAAVGLGAGIYLGTGNPVCVYLQNSGIGNALNPIISLLNREVYDIPMLFVVGWRGEPGTKDEPQHVFQGKITHELFHILGIETRTISSETGEKELDEIFQSAKLALEMNKQFALIVKKDTFTVDKIGVYNNSNVILREEAIERILHHVTSTDMIVSTTGKISREVYEQSDKILGDHKQNFLTVGSMGHAIMIAMGLAITNVDKQIICFDGDGAAFMHMGAIAYVGQNKAKNLIHIILNNGAHESVGGMPTGVGEMQFAPIARQCGYEEIFVVNTLDELDVILKKLRSLSKLTFIEINVGIGSRKNLGRPIETPADNKINFMKYHGVK